MVTQRDHYKKVLARHYTWMFGIPFDKKVREQEELLKKAGLKRPIVAVDLGCGSGFQSVALANMGAEDVIAIDTSAELLEELMRNSKNKPVTAHEGDLLDFEKFLETEPNTFVCMGDTITHLGSESDVRGLFRKIAGNLAPNGCFVLSWRDLSSPPEGLDRFIPLRQDDQRIMTCFLEDCGDTVSVHDLVYVKETDGWQLHKSSYPKLKLSPSWVKTALIEAGLKPQFEETVRGMTLLSALRPNAR